MAATWVNDIVEEEVSIALEHILFAPLGTAYDKSRVNVSSPPAGFIHLGAVVDDAPNLVVNKAKYTLATGIPRVPVYEVVIGMAGELSTAFHSTANHKAYFGLGGPRVRNIPVTAHTSTKPTVTAGTLSRNVVSVDTTAGFAVGQLVVTDASTLALTSYNVAYVNSVGGGNIYLSTEGFPFVPVTGQDIYATERTELALGTNILPFFVVLGVADFLNGSQVVHYFQKAAPRGQWAEALRSTQDARMVAVFDLYGYPNSTYDNTSQLILGERLQFAGNTIM